MIVLVIADEDNDATAAAVAFTDTVTTVTDALKLQFLYFRSHASNVGSVYDILLWQTTLLVKISIV